MKLADFETEVQSLEKLLERDIQLGKVDHNFMRLFDLLEDGRIFLRLCRLRGISNDADVSDHVVEAVTCVTRSK